jgi:hypothetical protein
VPTLKPGGKMHRTIGMIAFAAMVLGACSSGDDASIETDAPWQLVIVSDSFALGEWPQLWADLIEEDLGVEVDLRNHYRDGFVDYDEVIEEPDVRADLEDAEIILIPPEADHLRSAFCRLGDAECARRATEEYVASWDALLGEIRELNPDALLRSAITWAWIAPEAGRDGLRVFMEAAAEVTRRHGGVVADIDPLLTGDDHTRPPPPGWTDSMGHFTGPGASAVAEAFHSLGYEAPLSIGLPPEPSALTRSEGEPLG